MSPSSPGSPSIRSSPAPESIWTRAKWNPAGCAATADGWQSTATGCASPPANGRSLCGFGPRATARPCGWEVQGREPLTVPYPDAGAPAARVWIWGQACSALDAGDAAARWMSDALDKPVRLVAMDDRYKRRPDPDCTLPGDEVSFADCYPVLAIGRSSLDDLNTRTPAPASMRRFRPNFVVSGGTPYEEDGWRRIRIGSVEFEGVENCERCELPTVDPDTGVPDPRREPMRTLARYRRRATGGVFLGQNLVPRGAGTVRVGDRVVVIESAGTR